MLNGSDGIPLTGRVEAYATELWLGDPSAFWLHPEGPLSDTTPAEYIAKREAEADARRERDLAAALANPFAQAAISQSQNSIALNASQLAATAQLQAAYMSQGLSQGYSGGGNSLANMLFGGRW